MAGPTVLLTGGSRGIGLGVLRSLLETYHARVVTISRSLPAELEELSTKYPDNLTILQGDLTEESIHFQAVSTAISKYGSLDAVILNAGALELGRVADPALDVARWKAQFDINFFALLHTLHAAVPELRKTKGRVIFVSSGAAVKGVAGWGPYSASKAAMNSLTRTLATEEPDITSVALRPGTVDTGMLVTIKGELGGAAMTAEEHKKFQELKLLETSVPGQILAALAVGATSELSGGFYSWDAPELAAYRAKQ